MRKLFYEGRFIFIPLIAAAAITAIGFIVMSLWNVLLPEILHVGTITFWQAVGIFILCKILFGFGRGGGGFRGGRGRQEWMRHKMERRMRDMSPEERQRFKAQMKERMCGPRGRVWGRGFDWDEEKQTTQSQNPEA